MPLDFTSVYCPVSAFILLFYSTKLTASLVGPVIDFAPANIMVRYMNKPLVGRCNICLLISSFTDKDAALYQILCEKDVITFDTV